MTPRSFPFRTIATILTATTIGLSATPAQSEVIFQSEGNGTSFGVTIGGPNPGIEFSNAPTYQQYNYSSPSVYQSPQPFSNIYQYPSSNRPYESQSNIYQPPTSYNYSQPSYYQNPSAIYRQPSVVYRRTEIISPDGNQRVILEDPQYVVPRSNIMINPGDLRSVGDHRRYDHHHRRTVVPNSYRIPNTSIYYRF
jgi:hypothetical protein